MSEPIRVLLADDHRVYREGLRALLDGNGVIQIVGEVATGDAAIVAATQFLPDVILMDLKMPGTNGIDATRTILQRSPAVAVLVVTMFDDDASVFAALRAGARGYVLKDADQAELLRAITAVHGGEAIFGPAIARRMAHYFAGAHTNTTAQPQSATAFGTLTERERAVLELLARGQNNSAIAQRLSLSVKTVQNYVSAIFAKLQVDDRAQALLRARDAGFGKDT